MVLLFFIFFFALFAQVAKSSAVVFGIGKPIFFFSGFVGIIALVMNDPFFPDGCQCTWEQRFFDHIGVHFPKAPSMGFHALVP